MPSQCDKKSSHTFHRVNKFESPKKGREEEMSLERHGKDGGRHRELPSWVAAAAGAGAGATATGAFLAAKFNSSTLHMCFKAAF